jgi:hypothetical protein
MTTVELVYGGHDKSVRVPPAHSKLTYAPGFKVFLPGPYVRYFVTGPCLALLNPQTRILPPHLVSSQPPLPFPILDGTFGASHRSLSHHNTIHEHFPQLAVSAFPHLKSSSSPPAAAVDDDSDLVSPSRNSRRGSRVSFEGKQQRCGDNGDKTRYRGSCDARMKGGCS